MAAQLPAFVDVFRPAGSSRQSEGSIVRHIMNVTHTRTHPGAVIAAIPAKNEVETIGNCLQALACQCGAELDAVVVCLNNCTDDSAKLVRLVAPRLPFTVHVLQASLPSEQSFAGMARRIAMDRAAELAGPDGILLSTDADGQAAPGWVAGNLAALGEGIDAVAGRAEIEPVGAKLIPAHLHAADAEECAYAALLDEIRSLIDPDPADPWPRHDEELGASIAVTAAAYRHAGGIPAATLGEDRAFFAALRRIDARIRHARGVRVTVSARTVGRAAGGMADTMLRRMTQMDAFLDDRLEFVAEALHRASLRAQMRTAWRAKRAKSSAAGNSRRRSRTACGQCRGPAERALFRGGLERSGSAQPRAATAARAGRGPPGANSHCPGGAGRAALTCRAQPCRRSRRYASSRCCRVTVSPAAPMNASAAASPLHG